MTRLAYELARLDHADDSASGRARRAGWLQAVQYGFHEGRVNPDYEKLWHDHVEADDVVCLGAWLPQDAYGASAIPVATTSWFDKDLNCGRDRLPLRMITDVTTSPAHRRRGLVRRLMEDCLQDAADSGVPLAALTVSEATIYGRWGFGVATFATSIKLDTGPRFGLRAFTDPGRVELADPRETWELVRDQLDKLQARTRGAVGLPGFYEPFLTGRWNWQEKGEDKHLRAAVHLSPDEQVDGIVLYRPDGRDEHNWRKIKVLLLTGETGPAHLALWQFLAGIDLARSATHHALAPEDPLRWALTDINALTLEADDEFLWVRVLDLPRSFAARPWARDGEVVLEVDDTLGHAAGRWLVRTTNGAAVTEPTDREPDVRLDAETLGTLYLGPVDVTTLHRAGRLTGRDDGVARFAAMADLPDEPFNVLGF